MRVIVTCGVPRKEWLRLPIAYNSVIQGFIYTHLERALARWLHDEGTPFEKRQFRFFTFSRILGQYSVDDGTIQFKGPFSFHIGSVHEHILQSLAEHLLKTPSIQLCGHACELQSLEVEETPKMKRPIRVKTLSPITTYSTLKTAEGKKKTYYYTPFESDWEEQLLANLRRKANALDWTPEQVDGLDGAHIRPVRVDKNNLRIMKYRDTVIKGWSGIYELDLPEPFFLLAYDSGLGSKNPQGFGMVEVMESALEA